MNRKVAFIIIVVTLSLLIGGLIGFYFYTLRTNPGTTFLGQNPGRNFANYDPGNPNNQGNATTTVQDPSIIGTSTTPTGVPRLRKISVSPVAGSAFVNKDILASSTRNIEPEDTSRTGGRVVQPQAPRVIGTEEKIRFVDRAYGHVYETATSTTYTERLSNSTFPKIYEALFVEKGDSIIFRDLIGSTDVIGTRYATLAKATTTDTGATMATTLKDLTANLLQVVTSPAKNQLFSIQKDGITGFLSTPDGGAIQNILEIPFKEWLVQWPEARTILLTTKPSGFFPGYAYVLNPQNRSLTRILGGINGLTTNMAPDGNKLIYSRSDAGSFSLLSFDRRTSQSVDLQVKTLPEKCVWANTEADTIYCAVPENIAFNTYPDVWYQGRITFSDSLWKINIATREARLLSRLQDESGEIVDVQSIQINPKDDYLMFTNKRNLSLWGFRLIEPVAPAFNPLDAVGTSTATTSTTSR